MSILQKDPAPLSSTQAINLVAEQVKDLLYQLSKTISSIKVFSWQHAATQKMIHLLWENTSAFLARQGRLEIGVEEFAFTYRDRVVYRDEKAIKSLPFLFYRDGMKQLFIDKSLKELEFVEFLKIIREAFEMPSEECDIVNLLWERDLASIHCYAPDDFLEGKIASGKQPPMLYADPSELRMGFIGLAPEDKAMGNATFASIPELELSFDFDKPEAVLGQEQESAGVGPDTDEQQAFAVLSDQEDQSLRDMLQINRKLSPNGELVLMAGEILNLEANPIRFLEALEVISRIHQDLIAKADFHWAAELLGRMSELKAGFLAPNAFQREPLASFLERVKSRESLTGLKKILLDKQLGDFRPFFDYITLIGLDSLPLVIELCDTLRSPAFYAAMGGYLREIGSQSPSQLLHLASASRPALTREVIAALGLHPDKRIVLLLATFKGNWDKSIKQEAIRALSWSSNPGAVRVLCDFLNDDEMDIRVFAANNIRTLPDQNLADHIAEVVQSKEFHKKSLRERQAYLDLVGRQKSFEMRELLEGILRKRSGLFNRRRRTETRLAVVQTLAHVGGAESREILEVGAHAAGARIRRACREALERMPVESRPRPRPHPEAGAEPRPGVGADHNPEGVFVRKTEAAFVPEALPEVGAGPEALPEVGAELKTEVAFVPEALPEAGAEPRPGVGADHNPEGVFMRKTEAAVVHKPAPGSGPRLAAAFGPKPELKPEPKVEPEALSRPEAELECGFGPEPEPRPEPELDPKVEPKPEAEVKPDPASTTPEPKPEPKPEPESGSEVRPQPIPESGSPPEPKLLTAPESKLEPKPAPSAPEAKPAPSEKTHGQS